MTFGERVIRFLFDLEFDIPLSEGIEVMNPFKDHITRAVVAAFYHRFYGDEHSRRIIIGINPGRFGGGVTGVPFTDPVRLKEKCHIENPWPKKQELSSVYIYDMIDAYGGPEKFYRDFYITAVSPLGFTMYGKNLNYYDDKRLLQDFRPFAMETLKKQLEMGIARDVAYCLGDGKNYRFIHALNEQEKFFEKVIPLPHPRFIMQYKLKSKQAYIDRYLSAFGLNPLQ